MNNDPQNTTKQKAVDTGKSVHLSASAGSGKTRALKDRYLLLLDLLDRRGLRADQAVAITFTDKAAAEIKERVMRDLPEAMLKKIIRGSQDLRISTIHSFCMNLLKRYPLEAGLQPDFGVIDARDQTSRIQKAVEDTLEKLGYDFEIALLFENSTVDELISTVEYLISIRSRLKRMEIDSGGPENLVQSVRAGLEVDATELALGQLITEEVWRLSFEQMGKLLESTGDQYLTCRGPEHKLLVNLQDPASLSKIVDSIMPIYFTQESTPRKSARIPAKFFKTKKNRTEYETLFFKIQELLFRFKNARLRLRSSKEALTLLKLYLRAEEQYRDAKLREGLLDFDDLEIYAYRLLQAVESPDILYWLDRKILHFLVDEFQDTSDIQWAILKKLTEEIFSGQGTDKPMPPTLFVVGDEKQSIYRFREANYRLLGDIRKRMERNLSSDAREILSLDKNFRSTPEIIKTVNRVFSGLWGARYQPSEPERREHRGGVKLIEVAPASEAGGVATANEAEVLASEIHALVQNGLLVYELTLEPELRPKKKPGASSQIDLFSHVDDGWVPRPAGYGDCAVLIQSRTKLKEYESALQARNIPYRVVGGVGFYDEDEIRALMNILFFLWNPDDLFSLTAALKSPLFNLTDSELLRWREAHGNIFEGLKHDRPDVWRLLKNWLSIAGLTSISNLVHRIVEESCAYVRFGRLTPQSIFNIDKLLDTAREFDRRGYTTLQDFVEWVKNIRRTEQREATSDMNLPGFQGSVSIMTVHKAKGLEYPIVFLPGMNQLARSLTRGPEVLVEESSGQRRMAIKGADNPVYDDLWKGDSGEQEELRREHQRLLYVAMTRARDHLIMIGTRTNRKTAVTQNTWLDFLHQTVPLQQALRSNAEQRTMQYVFPAWHEQPLHIQQVEQKSVPARRSDANIDIDAVVRNLSPLPLSEGPVWKSATDLIEQKEKIPVALFLPESKTSAISPLTRGSMLHRCLEEFTRHGAYDLNRIIEEFPDIMESENSVQLELIADVDTVMKAVLHIDEFAWIFKQDVGSYSELPFLYHHVNMFVSGIIDRVVIRDGKGFVIDYKAIHLVDEQGLESWINHYRPQIRLYCAAVKEIFGLDSVEGYLLFLDSCRLQLTSKA